MDIKDLNKSQLLLLAVLLSFITSIATGITTVTLMQQAPTSFTAPVNRVIKQTVENIQQVEGKTTTQTVVVKEEDLVVDAIAKNQNSVFAVSKDGYDLEGKSIEIPIGRGFVVASDGSVAFDGSQGGEKDTYYLKNGSGKFKADFIGKDSSGVSFLKIGVPVDDKSKATYEVPSFGNLSQMKVGQKIIVMGNTIASSIYEGDNNINAAVSKTNSGALVLDLDGNALGMAISSDTTPFISISTITDALKSITKKS